uniref:Uncharacterized protein n=1 Tax=Rhodnius prolixus TaxID=13249 RepID=T1HN31_RHOPR
MVFYKYKSWRCRSFAEGMWLVLVTSIVLCCASSHIDKHPVDNKEPTANPVLEHLSGNEEDIDVNNLTVSTLAHSVEDVSETTSPIYTNASLLEEFNGTEYNISNCNITNELYLTSRSNGEDSSYIFNVGIIAGISVLVIIIVILIGVISFVLYRHLSWNRPQTLSDKFSNDESTGYIDDTAFRENSEEMYSLDNDSFLNSLEAMTIQNYWTDHVKHTKL